MLCLVFRNSLTIKSLFIGSVIFRNNMVLLRIVYYFRKWFRTRFWTWFRTRFWTWFWTWFWTRFWTRFWTWFRSWFWARFWTCSQVGTPILFWRSNSLASVSLLLYYQFFQGSSFYSKVFFHSCEHFKLQSN